jgi:hypothetical protein
MKPTRVGFYSLTFLWCSAWWTKQNPKGEDWFQRVHTGQLPKHRARLKNTESKVRVEQWILTVTNSLLTFFILWLYENGIWFINLYKCI